MPDMCETESVRTLFFNSVIKVRAVRYITSISHSTYGISQR